MTVATRPLELLSRHATIGVRFWDIARATSAIDGLRVEIFPRGNPRARKLMPPNLSCIYVGHEVPLMRDVEFSDIDPPELWTVTALRPYRIEVQDPQGRFLPVAFDLDLPQAGLFTWNAPWLSPPQAIVLPGSDDSPPQLMLEKIPLFSAPGRSLPDALAVVHAQMREPVGERPAAWALLGVVIENRRCGVGMADAEGRVAVMFPYPEPPRQALASPPEQRFDFTWPLDLEVFWTLPSPPPPTPPAIPDLASVLAQLDTPGTVNDAFVSPAVDRRLDYRVPLVARTQGASPPSSWLSVSPA